MDQIPIKPFAMKHEAVLLERLAMVRGDDNDRVLKQATLFEVGQEPGDLVIYEGNRSVVRIDCVLELGGRELHIRKPVELVHGPAQSGEAVEIFRRRHERFMHVKIINGYKERSVFFGDPAQGSAIYRIRPTAANRIAQ